MAIIVSLENMRGAIMASDTAGAIFQLGSLPIAAAIIRCPDSSVDWADFFGKFDDFFCRQASSGTWKEITNILRDYIRGSYSLFNKISGDDYQIDLMGYGQNDIFPSNLRLNFWFKQNGEYLDDISEMPIGPKDCDHPVILYPMKIHALRQWSMEFILCNWNPSKKNLKKS